MSEKLKEEIFAPWFDPKHIDEYSTEWHPSDSIWVPVKKNRYSGQLILCDRGFINEEEARDHFWFSSKNTQVDLVPMTIFEYIGRLVRDGGFPTNPIQHSAFMEFASKWSNHHEEYIKGLLEEDKENGG